MEKIKSPAVIFPFFLGLGFLVFFPTISGEPFWDDSVFFFNQKELIGASSPLTFFPGGDHPRSWPLFYSVLWSLYQLFGNWYPGYHITNIFIHCCNGFIFYLLLTKWSKAKAIILALIFLVHPLVVESVGWIFQLKTTCSFFFLLMSALFFKQKNRQNVLALIFFSFSLLVKSTSAPFSLAAYPLARKWGIHRMGALKLTLPFVLLAALSFVFTTKVIWSQWFSQPSVKLETNQQLVDPLHEWKGRGQEIFFEKKAVISTPSKWDIVVGSYIFYLKKTFLPKSMRLIHPPVGEIISYLKVIFTILALFLAFISIKKKFTPLILFFIVSLPLSGIFPLPMAEQFTNISEHWFYHSLPVFLVCLSPILRWPIVNKLVLFLIFPLAISSFNYAKDYGDVEMLFKKSVAGNPQNYQLHIGMAELKYRKEQYAQAIGWYKKALKIDDSQSGGYIGLIKCYSEIGDLRSANLLKNIFLIKRKVSHLNQKSQQELMSFLRQL